ncbi:hypothetical protein H181DRAFT_04029 [Streptomyces sp. WMMB 714]|jgi:hypothetical protein|uniref:hypothetical protein n=1 Tax=Streptomyces sp. WMMB 714 TaxID=1286822 RepID=UPI0005F7E6AE|nr:hypothetical protein [Streptomyces sp. WMMB 714]SCK45588.1 hypothetical protein H181DRAFT_04029 [Streptomyces sp. WMMB 714]
MPLTDVRLVSGRSIRLVEMRMSSTYGGLIVGSPSKRTNEFIVDSTVNRARNDCPSRPVHLVPPALAYPDESAGAFGPVEVMPRVRCTGLFESWEIDPAHNSGWWFSALTVVWFQHTTDLPAGNDAPADLREIAWEELAVDLEE